MKSQAHDFIEKLLKAASPSGFEQPVQELVRSRLEGAVDTIRTDIHGNVIAVQNPDAELRVMLAGHCDEIGLMVNHIDDSGYIYFSTSDGLDVPIFPGQRVEIHNAKDSVPGMIGKKTPCSNNKGGRPAKTKEYWIDIGASDRKDALKAVAVGDPITIVRKITQLRNGLISAHGLGGCAGVWAMLETMRQIRKMKLHCAVYGVSTVQKELGMRGAKTSAFGIDPHVGIAIDVGFSSDFPGSAKEVVGDTSLGKGPILHRGPSINPKLGKLMESVAQSNKIPYQIQAIPRPLVCNTDDNMIQINRAGAAVSLVSVPNRGMHTPVGIVSLKDLDNAVALLVATIVELKPGINFIP